MTMGPQTVSIMKPPGAGCYLIGRELDESRCSPGTEPDHNNRIRRYIRDPRTSECRIPGFIEPQTLLLPVEVVIVFTYLDGFPM